MPFLLCDFMGIDLTPTQPTVAKSGHGEGSRGGHIIGHTRSGKPVYEDHPASHPVYAGFSRADHETAAYLHGARAERRRWSMGYGTGNNSKEWEVRNQAEDMQGSHSDRVKAIDMANKKPDYLVPDNKKESTLASLRASRSMGKTPSGKTIFSGGTATAMVNQHPINRAVSLKDSIASDGESILAPPDHVNGRAVRPKVLALARKHFPNYTGDDHLAASEAHHTQMYKLLNQDNRGGTYPGIHTDVGSDHHAAAQFHLMAGHYLKNPE